MATFPKFKEMKPAPYQVEQLPQIPQLPVVGFPTLKTVKVRPPKVYENPWFNYDDPNQINSLKDILYKQINQIRDADTYLDSVFQSMSAVPEALADTVKLTLDSLKPGLRIDENGKWSPDGVGVGYNMLINFAETLDVIAMPVKGFTLGGGVEGVDQAFRGKNFDYNTGNLASDIGLEVVSDPLNWLTLGTKGAVSAVGKGLMGAALKEAGFETSEKSMKYLSKQLAQNYTGNWSDTVVKTFKHRLATGMFTGETNHEALKILQGMTLDASTLQVIKSLNRVADTAEKADSILFKIAMYTGTAGTAFAHKLVTNSAAAHYVANQLVGIVTKYDPHKEVNLVSYVQSLPELTLKIETMKHLDATLDIGDFAALIGQGAILKDFRDFRVMIAASDSGPSFVKQLDKTLEAMGHSFDEYDGIINRLAGMDVNLESLDRFLNLWNDIKSVRSAHIRQLDALPMYEAVKEANATFKDLQTEIVKHAEYMKTFEELPKQIIAWFEQSAKSKTISRDGVANMEKKIKQMQAVLHENARAMHADRLARQVREPDKLERIYEANKKEIDLAMREMYAYVERLDEFTKNIRANKTKVYDSTWIEERFKNAKPEVDKRTRKLIKLAQRYSFSESYRESTSVLMELLRYLWARPELNNALELSGNILHRLDAAGLDITNPRLFIESTEAGAIIEDALKNAYDELDNYIKNVDIKTNRHTIFEELQRRHTSDIATLLEQGVSKGFVQKATVQFQDFSKITDEQFKDLVQTLKDMRITLNDLLIHIEFPTVYSDLFEHASERSEELLSNLHKIIRSKDPSDWKFSAEDLESAFIEIEQALESVQRWLLEPINQNKITINGGLNIQSVNMMINDLISSSDGLKDMLLRLEGISLEGNKIMSFKYSQMNAMFSLLSIPQVSDIVDDIQTMGQAYTALQLLRGKFIDAHDEEMIYTMSTILSKLSGVGTTMDFMQNILSSNLPQHVQVGLIDSLQRVANVNLTKFTTELNYRDQVLGQLFDKTQAHINAGSMNTRHTLSAVSISEEAEIKAWAKEQGPEVLDIIENRQAHEAIRDIVVNKYLFDKLGMQIPAGKRGLFLDIESTGTGTGDQILELAYWLEGEAPVSVIVKPDEGVYPEPKVIKMLLGIDEAAEMDKFELYRLFEDKYRDGISEHAMLENLQEYLTKQDGSGRLLKDIVMVGHNLESFDVKHISKRRTLRGFDDYFKFETMDTLPKLRESTKYYALSASDKEQIAKMYRVYLRDKDVELFNIRESQDLANARIPEGAKYDRRVFLETPDSVLQDALYKLDKYRDDPNIRLTADEIRIIDELSGIKNELGVRLKDIKGYNKNFSRYYISTDRLDEMFPEMKLAADQAGYKLKDVTNLNITSALSNPNVKEYIDPVTGKVSDVTAEFQEMAAKTVLDTNLIKTFFYDDIVDEAVAGKSVGHINKMQRAAKEMSYIRDQVQKLDMLKYDLPELVRVSRDMLMALQHYTGLQQIDPILKRLYRNTDDIRTLFAQTVYLFRRFQSIKSLNGTVIITPRLEEMLRTPEMLTLYFNKDEDIIEDFFQLKELSDSAKHVRKFTMQSTRISFDDEDIDVLDQIDALLQINDLNAPKELVKKPILDPIYKLSDYIEGTVGRAMNRVAKDSEKSEVRAEIVRRMLEYDHQVTDAIYQQVINFTPADWESHLAHRAYGVWYTSKADLGKAFKNMGGAYEDSDAWIVRTMTNLPKDKFIIDAMGDSIFIGLRKEVDIASIAQPKELMDIKLTDKGQIIKTLVEDGRQRVISVLDAEEAEDITNGMNYVRKRLLSHAPSASGSTMEVVTKSAMQKFMEKVPDKFRDAVHHMDDFGALKKFEGFNFNHSAVGYAELNNKTGRKAMFPFFSANPVKNYAITAQDLADKMSVQAKYTALMRDSSLLLNGDILGKMTDDDLFQMLSDRREYKLGFLTPDKKIGYKMKTVVLRSAKDVAFARSVDAVILPTQVFNKARGVINDYRVTNTLAKIFEKYVVGPTKIGAITSPGMVMRNIIDSTTKTFIHSETPEIIPHFIQTAAHYVEYSRIIKEVIDKYGHLTKEGLADYFATHETKIDRAYFDLLDEFIQDGASAGLTAHLQQYLGDMTKTLHRRIRGEMQSDIDYTTLNNFLNGSDSFRDSSLYKPEIYAELTRLRSEYGYMKQAIAMRSHTRLKELSVNDIIRYLKQPERIPPNLMEEWGKIIKHKDDVNRLAVLDKAIYNNPYTHVLLGANGWFEQVMRLTQYTYDVTVKDMSKSSAMAGVIKTHFDYSHRTLGQQYMEWVLPFSTFAFNNLQFWADVAETKPWVYGIVRDFMSPIIDLGEHDSNEAQSNMSLQAQMLSGNAILDKETGFNIKLNPSVMDALKIMTDPKESIEQRIAPYIKGPYSLVKGTNYWGKPMTKEDKDKTVIGMLPLVGPALIRAISGVNASEQTGTVLNKVVPSVFGRTNQKLVNNGFGQRAVYEPFAKTAQYKKYAQKKYSKKYLPTARKVFPASVAPFNNIKYNRITDFTGYTAVYRKMTTKKTLRNDLFTSKGRMRLQLMMIKPKTGDAGHRLANIMRMW